LLFQLLRRFRGWLKIIAFAKIQRLSKPAFLTVAAVCRLSRFVPHQILGLPTGILQKRMRRELDGPYI
ncbi:MAG: hypothetical protein EBX53_12230, partial [Betaproteobacteria bacterium]|nr:hypothetical protein [Betaproteobacteria bacterium]